MRVKLFAAILAFSTAMTPVAAHADPITWAITSAITTVANAIGVSVAGQAILGSFLLQALPVVGGALLSVAANFAINALFAPDAPAAPKPQDIQSNYQLDEAPRFKLMGRVRAGGAATFTETKDGYLYKLIAHGDSEATEEINTYMNDIPVTLSGSTVTNSEFSAGGGHYYVLIKRYGTATQSAMPLLTSAFSEWTSNHVGAGVADTLMRLRP